MGRAAARGLAVGGLLAALFALSTWVPALVGLVWGLVAAPLAWLEAWGERHGRPLTAVLLAWTVAAGWPAVAYLHVVYLESLYATGDPIAAFELVRAASGNLLPSGGSYEQVGLLVPFAFLATSFAWAVAIRLRAWRGVDGRAFAAVAGALLLLIVLSLGALIVVVAAACVPALVLLPLYAVTDALVARVLGPASHLDGAPDGC